MRKTRSELPLIGFIPLFDNLGETYPLVAIAKKYIELGGEAIFFSYGEGYQYLAREIGCEVIDLPVDLSEKEAKKNEAEWKKYFEEQSPREKFYLRWVNKDFYQYDVSFIKKQVKAFKDADVKLIVTGFCYPCIISARKANIPLVFIVSGSAIPPYYQQNLASFPDNYENFFIRFVPSFIKNRIANWFILNSKSSVKEFNRLASTFDTQKINHFLDLLSGDYTLVAEDISFLNIKPTEEFPAKNFVGPIFPEIPHIEKDDNVDIAVKKHLERSGKSILVSLGSSGTKKLFLEILRALEKTDFNVVAVYTTIFDKNDVPIFKDNILPVQFVSSIKKVNESVDIAIIHGGRGTVYTAAYAGKPVIGIPYHVEQQCNIDNLVRHGSAIRLSRRNFNERELLTATNKIFANYDTFLKNAQLLKEKLQEPKGAENTVKRLLEIFDDL